jgi:hypothetical protein
MQMLAVGCYGRGPDQSIDLIRHLIGHDSFITQEFMSAARPTDCLLLLTFNPLAQTRFRACSELLASSAGTSVEGVSSNRIYYPQHVQGTIHVGVAELALRRRLSSRFLELV